VHTTTTFTYIHRRNRGLCSSRKNPPFGPTAYFTLSNTVMRHDIPNIGTMSEAYPHLIFHNFNSKLGERVSVALSVFCSFDMTLQWMSVMFSDGWIQINSIFLDLIFRLCIFYLQGYNCSIFKSKKHFLLITCWIQCVTFISVLVKNNLLDFLFIIQTGEKHIEIFISSS